MGPPQLNNHGVNISLQSLDHDVPKVKKGGLAVMVGGEVKADGKFSGGTEAGGQRDEAVNGGRWTLQHGLKNMEKQTRVS